MLFHNDCMYIAHHLLTMGHEFQATIPLPITMAWCVDNIDAACAGMPPIR
jgi:hypothetical protein